MHRGSSLALSATLLALTAHPAAAEPRSTPLDSGLLSPLSVAVGTDGTIWYAENYAGLLHRRATDGTVSTPVRARGDLEVAAVGELDGTVWYAVTGAGHTVGELHRRDPDGTDTVQADLYAHEQQAKPDARFRYGFRGLPKPCRSRLPEAGRASYRGPVETHPVAALPAHGAVYVADAAANAVTAVVDGTATTVAALPPVRTTMTQEYAERTASPPAP